MTQPPAQNPMTPADVVVAAAVAATTAPVFDTIVPKQPPGLTWAVIYPDEGSFDQLGLCDAGDVAVVTWQVNAFGPTRAHAARVLADIRSVYLAGWLAIPGWLPGNPVHDQTIRARPDEGVRAVPLVVVGDLFTMTITKETT